MFCIFFYILSAFIFFSKFVFIYDHFTLNTNLQSRAAMVECERHAPAAVHGTHCTQLVTV